MSLASPLSAKVASLAFQPPVSWRWLQLPHQIAGPLQLCYRTRWLCPVGGQSWQYQQFCHWTHLSTRQWISWSWRSWWQFKGDLRMSLSPVSLDWFGDCSNGPQLCSCDLCLMYAVFQGVGRYGAWLTLSSTCVQGLKHPAFLFLGNPCCYFVECPSPLWPLPWVCLFR